jgi:hypothetical protein
MPIVAGDIDFHLSGGTGNSDPNASLGGRQSNTEIVDATVENLFDNVSGDESAAGDTEYRCFYIRNAHGSLTLEGATLWKVSPTPTTSDENLLDFALDPSGVTTQGSTDEPELVGNESTAPSGIVFTEPLSKGAGLVIGDIPAGSIAAVWCQRGIVAGAQARSGFSVVLRVEGDTAA